MQLFVNLDKTYKAGEKYTLYIAYTAKPNELETKGSAAITSAKGLYFINPTGEDKNKPTQIWTQGETEANSVWMPTIDKPNQKSTAEILMTVPAKYVTLSNGLLTSKKVNADGTRTDYWKMDQPHAPYLFFMGVGDFAIIKDSYKGKEVSYYVEKNQAPFARGVFGATPEMIRFFSTKLQLEYPWAKYAQMVGRDYVSGAMENTTATLHQESAYQNARQLTEGNSWEETIAHELFHQWFGDLVTAESWSHLTVNESFANYSEYLWDEYKHGKDFADDHNLEDMQGYLQSGSNNKHLVRYHYADKEDMFDAVSYNKGGRILHMLRNFVGDDAFYKSLNTYLTTNKYKTGEAAQLRLAFEEVTGQDMNWFWNQWYYGSGHPKVDISYLYEAGMQKVIIRQLQAGDKLFKLPIAIDIYEGQNRKRYNVWSENKVDTFSFPYAAQPTLVNVDADKILLWEKTDNKTAENFVAQYRNARNYMDRREALRYFAQKDMKELQLGLEDKFAGLRSYALNALAASKSVKDAALFNKIEQLAEKEQNKKTKAAAISFLATTKDAKYEKLYSKFVNDSSYSVSAAALEGLSELAPASSYQLARKYSSDAKGALGDAVFYSLVANGSEADYDFIAKQYEGAPPQQEKLEKTAAYAEYLLKVNDVNKIKKAIDDILAFRGMIPSQYRTVTDPVFKQSLDKLAKAKGSEIEKYVADGFK
jgi:aminopeptidase N